LRKMQRMLFIAYAAFICIFSAMYAIYCICSIYLHISVHPTETEL